MSDMPNRDDLDAIWAWKRERDALEEWVEPEYVAYGPCRFEKENLDKVLNKHGLKIDNVVAVVMDAMSRGDFGTSNGFGNTMATVKLGRHQYRVMLEELTASEKVVWGATYDVKTAFIPDS